MSSEQPSLFDQLTPSDSLRDDLAWIDSLQEDTQEDDKPARQERKPRKRRGRKNIPTEHEPEHVFRQVGVSCLVMYFFRV